MNSEGSYDSGGHQKIVSQTFGDSQIALFQAVVLRFDTPLIPVNYFGIVTLK